MNNVSLTGRVSKDAEVRATTTGKNVATFSVAVDRPYTYGDKKQTDFFNIVWWLKSDKMAEYLLKGQQVAITGYVTNRSFTGKDGQKKYITEVIVENLNLIGGAKQENLFGKVSEDDGNVPF